MLEYNKVVEELIRNKKVRKEGGFNCIPWRSLPKLSSVVPGIQKGRYYICTANSKVGKTILTDFLFLHEPIKFLQDEKPDIRLKIFYFSLEISKEEKIKQVIAHKLFRDKMPHVNPEKLSSVFQDYILDDATEEKIKSYSEEFKEFENIVTYIDNIRNPYGIYKYVRDYAESHGDYYDKDNNIISLNDAHSNPLKINSYKPHDPNEYVIIITDHIGLLTPEGGQLLHAAMSSFSNNYSLKMRDRWNYVVVNVQQQAAEQEKQQFNIQGRSVVDKLRPSPDGLGDNKLTGRDCDLMFGLFAPFRYKIEQYMGYNIVKLGDHHRELSILLNRRGAGFVNVQMYYNGAASFFSELPPPEEINYTNFI